MVESSGNYSKWSPSPYDNGGYWIDLSNQSRNVTINEISHYVGGNIPHWYFPDVNNQRLVGVGGNGNFFNGVTLEFWINPEGSSTAGGLFETINGGSGQNRLYMDSSGVQCNVQPIVYSDGTFTSTISYTKNVWQQLVFTYYNNGGLGYLSFYKNGQLLNSVLDNQAYNYGTIDKIFYIGTVQGDSYKFKGKIAIVKQYNRVLSLNEISQSFNEIKSRFNL